MSKTKVKKKKSNILKLTEFGKTTKYECEGPPSCIFRQDVIVCVVCTKKVSSKCSYKGCVVEVRGIRVESGVSYDDYIRRGRKRYLGVRRKRP